MPRTAIEQLRAAYDNLREQRQALLDQVQERVLGGGEGLTVEERADVTRMNSEIDEAKEQWEAQRDLEGMVSNSEPLSTIEGEVDAVAGRGEESLDTSREMARAIGGREGLEAFDQRSAEFLATFEEMSRTGNVKTKLSVNPHLAMNFAKLRDMGVSPRDYVAAIRAGHLMLASRAGDGEPDVRLYSVGTSGQGQELVPTFWDNSLYEFASYVGGVQNSGAEVIPVMGNNELKLPRVTGFAAGIGIAAEGTQITTETNNTTSTFSLNPRPYRGFAAETDEIMRAAVIDVRAMLVLRGLARALQLGKEDHFHNGTGSGQPKGILHGVAAGRIVKTGGDAVDIRYQDIPNALGMLDAEYHMSGRPGALVSLMHSATWFRAFVGSTGTDGHPLYPHLAQGLKEIFSTRVNFSHKIASAVAADALLAVVGNFLDAYVIATMGGQEIQVTDDARFLEWERVYRIQEYCDGTVRDDKAVAYVQSAD